MAGTGRPADSVWAAMASRRKAPAPPWRTPSSAVTTRRWRAASSSMARSGGETTRASHTVASIPSRGQLVGRAQAGRDRLAHAEEADRPVAGAQPARLEPAPHVAGVHVPRRGLGHADGGGPGQLEGGAQHRLDLFGRGRREDRHAGDGQRQRQVEDAVVARPVVAGDAGPVEHEDHRAAVQAHVEVGLVEGARPEGRVHRHHGPQTRHGHAGGRRRLVLLGDADVEEAVGEAGLEGQQARRPGHGRGERHDARVLFGRGQQGPR